MILTGSQLLFFKDPVWALTLQQQLQAEGVKRDDRGQILLPRVAKFVPDEVFPLKDAVAVLDRRLVGVSHLNQVAPILVRRFPADLVA